MNLLFGRIRERIGAAIGVALLAVCFLVMGIIMAFVVSPQQALEWRRVQRLPVSTASTVESAPVGTEILISGTLTDNPAALADTDYVAYRVERWEVTVSGGEDGDTTETGKWQTVEQVYPALKLAVDGGTINTTAVDRVNLGGSLHEAFQQGTSDLTADDMGTPMPDGSTRTNGLYNGDLVSVLGSKASNGDLVPERLFGGDRVQLVDAIRSGARAAFAGGIAMMICSPIVLVGGLWAVLFGRRKNKIL